MEDALKLLGLVLGGLLFGKPHQITRTSVQPIDNAIQLVSITVALFENSLVFCDDDGLHANPERFSKPPCRNHAGNSVPFQQFPDSRFG